MRGCRSVRVIMAVCAVAVAVSSAPVPEASPDDIIPEKTLVQQGRESLLVQVQESVQETTGGCVVAHGRIYDVPGTSIGDLAAQMAHGHLFFGGQSTKWAKCSKGAHGKCSLDIGASVHMMQKAFEFLTAVKGCPPASKTCAASIVGVSKEYAAFAAAARVTKKNCKGKGKGRTGTCIVTKRTMKSLFYTIKYMVDSTKTATPGSLKALNILDKQGPLMMTAVLHSMGEFFSAATTTCTALNKAVGSSCASSSAQLIKHLDAFSKSGMSMSKACTPDRHYKAKLWHAAKLEAQVHELSKKQLPTKHKVPVYMKNGPVAVKKVG